MCPPDRTTAADDTDTTGPTDPADQTTALPERFLAISLTRRTEPTSAAVIVYRVAFDGPTGTHTFVHRITWVSFPRGDPAHRAGTIVSLSPTRPGSTEIRGRAVDRGPPRAIDESKPATTGPIAALATVDCPYELVAVTTRRR